MKKKPTVIRKWLARMKNEDFIYMEDTSSTAFSNPCSSNSQPNFDILTAKLVKGKGPGRTKVKFDFKFKKNSKPRDEFEMFLKEIIVVVKKIPKFLENKETIRVLDLKSFSHNQNTLLMYHSFITKKKFISKFG